MRGCIVPGTSVYEASLILRRLSERWGAEYYPIEHRFATTQGSTAEVRWSGSIAWLHSSSQAVGNPELHKIRCYFDPTQHRLALVPIRPTTTTLNRLFEFASRLPATLKAAWDNVADNIVEYSGDDKSVRKLIDRSLVTWSNYLFEFSSASQAVREITEQFSYRGLTVPGACPQLSQFDIQLLTGTESSDAVVRVLSEALRQLDEPVAPADPRPLTGELEIPGRYRQKYQNTTSELIGDAETAYDVLEGIFKAQHIEIELPSRSRNPDDARLEFGIPYSLLFKQVQTHLPGETFTNFNQALDSLIDRGVIVPRYLPQNDEEAVWYRSFRVGEGQSRAAAHAVAPNLCTESACQALCVLG